MKRILWLTPILLVTGCSTAIGPLSYWASTANQSARIQRSVALSQSIPAEKKVQIVKALNMGCRESEVSMGFAISMSELLSSERTLGESILMGAAQLGDAGLYTGLLNLIREEIDDANDKGTTTPTVPTPTINGNGNQVNIQIQTGSGTQDAGNQSDSENQ